MHPRAACRHSGCRHLTRRSVGTGQEAAAPSWRRTPLQRQLLTRLQGRRPLQRPRRRRRCRGAGSRSTGCRDIPCDTRGGHAAGAGCGPGACARCARSGGTCGCTARLRRANRSRGSPRPPALAIVPLPPEQATERALGARCPVDLAGRLATQGDLLIGACQGTMPAHLAALLVALPVQDIHLPRSWREREVRQKAWFKAVPGYGQRPDFIVRMGDIWVRSLEGRDADSTFYLVSAPFTCSDQVANRDEYGAEPVRVPAGECREAHVAQRVYQVRGDAAPRM